VRGRRRPEDLLGEWGVRDVTPGSRRERRRLEAEHELNPFAGRPLRRRLRNFHADSGRYLASLGGPLPYMQRLREIEREVDRHLAALEEAYAEHEAGSETWAVVADGWDFALVNELIDRHNRWYPTESRLPMDPRTRDFVQVGGRSYTIEPLDAAWILARFP
jgi:hypothetical protein